jgi:hypothetical protein
MVATAETADDNSNDAADDNNNNALERHARQCLGGWSGTPGYRYSI